MAHETPRADKELGQHYLKDNSIINKINSDHAKEAASIIEIGPGPATLTKGLAALNKPLFLVEKDPRFKEILLELVSPSSLYLGDALHDDWDKQLEHLEAPIWLVSNLPYNISSQLLVRFLQLEKIKMMTLMFQKEVGQKVFSLEKNSMSSLMALSTTYFDVSKLAIVKPGAFQPPPKVDSIVLSFKRKAAPNLSLQHFFDFEKFMRGLFSERRKQIGNILKKHHDENKVKETFLKLGIDPMRRSETLSLVEVQDLYKTLCLN